MQFTFDFTEINKMADRYADGVRVVHEEVRAGMTASVIQIEADAKRRVPTDTHVTQRSITHEVVDSGSSVIGRAGTNIATGDGKSLGQLIEEGRTPGKMPPAGALVPWMGRHGIDLGGVRVLPGGVVMPVAPKKSTKTGYYQAEYQIARAINKKKKPRPFLKPAYEANRLKIQKEFGTAVPRRIIARLAGQHG